MALGNSFYNLPGENVTLDEDGELFSMVAHEMSVVAEAKCEYLSPEQFARQYNVTTKTVNKWIREGKIRSAKKSGDEWLIPALADKPQRSFTQVNYFWDYLEDSVVRSFPYLSEADSVYISQNTRDKAIFHVSTKFRDSEERRGLNLTRIEREQLEFALISAGVENEDPGSALFFYPIKIIE